MPRTAKQAGATYCILALIMFLVVRFICTFLMRIIKPQNILTALALLAFVGCMITILVGGYIGIYALVMIPACMSLMFPTKYGMGIKSLGDDTKIGGSGMVKAIAFLIIAYNSIIVYK